MLYLLIPKLGKHNIERVREVEKMGKIKEIEKMERVKEIEEAIAEIK